MKKVKKICLITLLCIIYFQNICFGVSNGYTTADLNVNTTSNFVKFTNSTLGVVLYIIMKVAQYSSAIILVIIGIKYFLGSTEEKALTKKAMMIYLIGFALVFGASSIASYIFKMVS